MDAKLDLENNVPTKHSVPSEYVEPTLAEFLVGQYHIEPKVDQTRADGSPRHVFNVEKPVAWDITQNSIDLEASIDPFASRDGKTLTWQNVNMKLVSSQHDNSRSWCPMIIPTSRRMLKANMPRFP